ncbi:class I SAM-dependent methyltransferase [Luteimonas sp. RIT-PG2_3]
MSYADPALEALLLPFSSGQLAWPGDGALFLGARPGAVLRPWSSRLICEQGFKPAFDALQRDGFDVRAPTDERRALVLVLPPRQRDEARALFAQALQRVTPGGVVIASLANDEGAKAGQADLARLMGPVSVLTKHKCRVFWATARDGAVDPALAAEWQALDATRPIEQGRFFSRPGVFAWDRIDTASRLLAQALPPTLAGHAADLGAGYGYLSAELLQRCPGVQALDVFEAQARALALAQTNLTSFASRATLGFHWHDVTAGLPGRYDVIVSNPPFHGLGRDPQPAIGRAFIAAAANALKPRGQIWLVANRQLPYEDMFDARFAAVSIVAQQQGFKVIHAERGR